MNRTDRRHIQEHLDIARATAFAARRPFLAYLIEIAMRELEPSANDDRQGDASRQR